MNMKQFRPLRVNKCRSANENHGTFSCYGRDRHGKRGIQVFQCQRVLREKSAAVEIEPVDTWILRGRGGQHSCSAGRIAALVPHKEQQGHAEQGQKL